MPNDFISAAGTIDGVETQTSKIPTVPKERRVYYLF
ncbi:hypothetical protein BH11BAC5_BH11BAC5_22970 [soil metagenome]